MATPSDYIGALYYDTSTGTAGSVTPQQVYGNDPYPGLFNSGLGYDADAPGGTGTYTNSPAAQDATTSYTQTQNTYTPPPDPYARWGGIENYNNLVSGFQNQKNTIYDTGKEASDTAARGYDTAIQGYINSLKDSKGALDQQAAELWQNKFQGMQDVNNMVGRGINSGATMLANKNALDSSASGAIARAYGTLGRDAASKIGQQFEKGQTDLSMASAKFGRDRDLEAKKLDNDKANYISSIVSDAQNKLASLDAAMRDASITDIIDIEAEKQRIRDYARNALSQFDSKLSGGRTTALRDRGGNVSAARSNMEKGRATSNQFNYGVDTTTKFQNPIATGQLPIYTYPRNNREG